MSPPSVAVRDPAVSPEPASPPAPKYDPAALLARYQRARDRRASWDGHWRDCVAYTLPQRDGAVAPADPGQRAAERIFDATAGDAAEQLAASLLAELTPPWSRWIGLVPGTALDADEAARLAPRLADAEAVLQGHFDRSNFAVEMHQCFLDLVVLGTACLSFEEAALGASSAFRFSAVPLREAVLEEGPDGQLDVTFRRSDLTTAQLIRRFGRAQVPEAALADVSGDAAQRFPVVEAVLPDGSAYDYVAVLDDAAGGTGPRVLAEGRFGRSPFINFRWMKAPGEVYGRSPVMRALPDIRTANKVVELTLKNASIAVTGIWQADDDGVLNPATVRLVPGTIIPKAVGSSGLTPLAAPGQFDVSELVLSDLRERIRRTLLTGQLGQPASAQMTATEVLERSQETARVLGATYGRLQAELLTPLVARALAILSRRGEIDEIGLDGRTVQLQLRAPLAQLQAQKDVANTVGWIERAAALGEAGLSTVDLAGAARWIGETMGVPAELIRPQAPADGESGEGGDV
ncbi:portal protein [Rhodovibrio salinarum]|uniref:Phage tail protein n=1 Tax=Rhodovibrio salinarum TaxID=1087 RepID=A0A934V3E4_9PROT|nr:portal protein [Rhodovibrio salinarum]MBK1699239.1 phage tail protein [Rhodovibrio salinarum]